MAKEALKEKGTPTATSGLGGEMVPAAVGGALVLNTVAGRKGLVAVPPAELEVFEDVDAPDDTGLSDIKGSDRRIPILRILAGNSPQVTQELPGAKGGAIFNTSTSQIYSGKLGLYVIVCYVDKKYVKYIKRNEDGSGGGFVAVLEPDDPEVKRCQDERMKKFGNLFGKLHAGTVPDLNPDGSKNLKAGEDMELVETKYAYCICIVPNEDGSYPGTYGEMFPALIPFESTKIKAFDSWVERNKTFRYPMRAGEGQVVKREIAMWSHVWRLQTAPKQRGTQSWHVWTLALAARDADGVEKHYSDSRIGRNDPLYMEAEKFRTVALEGNADIDFQADKADAPGEASQNGGNVNDEIPFGR